MYLRDITIHADKSIVSNYKDGFVLRFSRDAQCCISLFLSLIPRKIETKGTMKIALTFTDDKMQIKEHHHMYPEQPDVLIFTWLFPFERYVAATELEKKCLVFSSMYDCVKHLAKQYEWDTKPLDDAKEKAESDDFQYTGYLKHSWVSHNSKWRARIYFDFGLEFIKFYCCLFKNRSKTELGRRYMGQAVPLGCPPIKKLDGKWYSDTQFELISPNFQKIKWEVDLSEIISKNSC